MFPFSYNPYTNECFIQPNVFNAPQNQQDLFCISPFGVQRTQPVIKRTTVEPQNLLWKFSPGEDGSDELTLGKRVSSQQVSTFLQQQQRLKLKRQQKQMFDPIFGSFAAALFDQAYNNNSFTSLDYEQAGEALSRKVFKNYKFSITKNEKELVVVDENGQLVKIFELEDAYEGLAVKSMFMEDNVAVIKLVLFRKQNQAKNLTSKKTTKTLKKKRSNSNNRVQKTSSVSSSPVSVNDAIKALDDLNMRKEEEEQEARKITAQKERAAAEEEAQQAETKRLKELEEANRLKELEEANRLKDLEEAAAAEARRLEEQQQEKLRKEKEQQEKLRKEQERLMLAKKERLEKAKQEYEAKQQKLKEKQERMNAQAAKLKERERKLQEIYESELAKLVQEVEEKENEKATFTVHSPAEDSNTSLESSEDVEMNEESSCSTDEDDAGTSKTEPKLAKTTSIVVEDIEDESDKDYKRSLLNSPTSNAVLEGI